MEFREISIKRYRSGNKKELLRSVVGQKGLRLREKWYENGVPWYKGFERIDGRGGIHYVGRNYSQNDKGKFSYCISFGDGTSASHGVLKRSDRVQYYCKDRCVTKELLSLVKDPQNLEPHEEGLVWLKYGFKREHLEVLSCIKDVLGEWVCD